MTLGEVIRSLEHLSSREVLYFKYEPEMQLNHYPSENKTQRDPGDITITIKVQK